MYSTLAWNPGQHLHDAGPRTRPFHDLFAHVPDPPGRPARIVDLGCGRGDITAVLAERWPDAHITGLDNSAETLRGAKEFAGETAGGGSIDFAHADLADWVPTEPFDLIMSSAALQWVQNQPERFETWTRALSPGGIFAFQVPDNAAAAGHAVFRELCTSPARRDRLGTKVLPALEIHEPAEYVDLLAPLGFDVNAWKTTYAHVLPGDDPFAGWIEGSGMRPVLTALADDPEAIAEFLAVYRARLRDTYPAESYGTVFPFSRVFVVARKRRTA